jgi:putative radical SAM enzyme (TIGR03279 family)
MTLSGSKSPGLINRPCIKKYGKENNPPLASTAHPTPLLSGSFSSIMKIGDLSLQEGKMSVTVEINKVRDGSIGAEMEIEAGDILLLINDHPVNDIIDYQFYTQDDNLLLEIQKPNQEIWQLDIEKDFDEDLGLEFEGIVFDKMKACSNRCIFCFVDQLPRQMRRSLYVKDDDYRYSFLYGNFITLTNLHEEDWQKIALMQLSPLYISVHCMQGDLRARMLENDRAANIKSDLERLKAAHIMVHTQIVLCPGINDGPFLAETIEELARLYPSVQSVGIVPVGLTGHRGKLPEIQPVGVDQSQALIHLTEQYQKRFRSDWETGFVYLADEFYLRAGQSLPTADYYDDYCQLENGIGLSRLLLDEFAELANRLPAAISPREIFIITGLSAVPVLNQMISQMQKIKGLTLDLIPVENQFFGEAVSVTGLLTGGDIIRTLGQSYKGKTVLIPEVLLRDGQQTLLDDLTIKDIMESSGAEIVTVDGSAHDLIEKILKHELADPMEERICQNP